MFCCVVHLMDGERRFCSVLHQGFHPTVRERVHALTRLRNRTWHYGLRSASAVVRSPDKIHCLVNGIMVTEQGSHSGSGFIEISGVRRVRRRSGLHHSEGCYSYSTGLRKHEERWQHVPADRMKSDPVLIYSYAKWWISMITAPFALFGMPPK